MNVLITQIYCYASIGLTKIIKRNPNLNATIHATDVLPIGLASGSLLVDYFYQIPSYETNKEKYLETLSDIIKSNCIDILISVDEKELIVLLENEDLLNVKIVSANLNMLKLFNNKEIASIDVNKLGIPTPKIILDLRNQEKVIFRKKVSVGSKGIYIADIKNDTIIENHFNDEYFIQEYIHGEEYTVDIFADNYGEPKLIIPRKRIEIRNGLSFKCQLIKNDTLIDYCKIIAYHYKIPGLYNLQFICDKENAYFIELNPRFSGSGITSVLASFDFIELFLKHSLYNYKLDSYDFYMRKVAWNSIITRYYEESIYFPD